MQAILFDLDGTLIDSAPDLTGTLNDLRQRRGLTALPSATLRPMATRGALGLLEAGFPDLSSAQREDLREEFIARYRQRLWVESKPFDGMKQVLETLRTRSLRLGIVTNKIESLARPLVQRAGWHHLFDVLIGGDTTGTSKPDARPVLAACEALDLLPEECVLVGDDRRDVLAGQAAGVGTVAVSWGYSPADDDPADWNADHLIHRVNDILNLCDGDDGANGSME